jgi:SAM-dependent methyltransferase
MNHEELPTGVRLEAVERKLELLRLGVVAPEGDATAPPVGGIADFIGPTFPQGLIPRAERDQLPIPAPGDREGYKPRDHAGYWVLGLEDHDKVMDAARELSVGGSRIYDFGGSTGRVFRHFYCQDESFEVWSSDFKLASYQWNQRYFPKDLKVFLNTFVPALPLPDRHFDVITAFSVFTHIDELESPWLVELRRILKPGGLLYVTIHDEVVWENMPLYQLETLQQSSNGQYLTADSAFPGPRRAFHFRDDSYYSCQVFHGSDYIHREWGRFFEIVDMRPLQHAERQCVVLLRYTE